MAEAILRIETEYSLSEAGLVLPSPGAAMIVVGQVVTEHFRTQLEDGEMGVKIAPDDGIVLVSPEIVVKAAREHIRDEQLREIDPQAAARQNLPRLILPGSLQA